MTVRLARPCVLACALLAIPAPAFAQESDDPFETARFRMGVVRFTPTLELTSLGRDSNVFNEADDPKADTTAAIGPTVQFWMRPGRARISGRTGGQYLYFREYQNQRAWNTTNDLRIELLLARLTPFAAGSYTNTKERQGYEIDSRSRRRDISAAAGVDLRVGGKTNLVGSYRVSRGKFDEDETFLGAVLARELNRDEQRFELQVRHALTPLTTFVVRNEIAQDRFERSPLRDSDSLRIMPGFELKPDALISGSVFVGYRDFDARDAGVPDYRGVVAAVSAVYTRHATRFEFKIDRDLAYSYSTVRPYYALLDTGVTMTHRFATPWELVLRGGRQTLDYRLAGEDTDDAPHDTGYLLGGGLGFRFGETLRVGFDVIHSTRRSEVEGRRDFDGTRIFGSLRYGIRQ